MGPGQAWTVAEAEAKLDEIVDRARVEGPQVITRNDHAAVVVVSFEEWERKAKRAGSLADFLAASPLRGSELEVERASDNPHETKP